MEHVTNLSPSATLSEKDIEIIEGAKCKHLAAAYYLAYLSDADMYLAIVDNKPEENIWVLDMKRKIKTHYDKL